jgi:hypothetical protein
LVPRIRLINLFLVLRLVRLKDLRNGVERRPLLGLEVLGKQRVVRDFIGEEIMI